MAPLFSHPCVAPSCLPRVWTSVTHFNSWNAMEAVLCHFQAGALRRSGSFCFNFLGALSCHVRIQLPCCQDHVERPVAWPPGEKEALRRTKAPAKLSRLALSRAPQLHQQTSAWKSLLGCPRPSRCHMERRGPSCSALFEFLTYRIVSNDEVINVLSH